VVSRRALRGLVAVLWLLLGAAASAAAQDPGAAEGQPGSIRGFVTDLDFDVPLPGAQVLIVETGQAQETSDQGGFVFPQVAPGRYTLVFTKEGYVRQVKADVLVTAGQLTDVDVSLSGEFTEMDEFLVQDVLQFGAGTEAALLKLRFDSPAIMNSISSDLMSRAGASDAAAALTLVSGASLQDGKTAVIRGLPDRYVSSQLNGVRMPSADEDTRAVQLDQFPAAVIESIQVSKTFTPDQQGDASGGAVNVVLKSIPDENFVQVGGQISANTQAFGEDDFLSYDGGGLDFFGGAGNDPQPVNASWKGAVGTSTESAPTDYKLSLAAGGKRELDNGVKVGGLASFFYERDSSFYDNGKDDSYWVETPGAAMTPEQFQGTVFDNNFKTGLYDVTKATQSEQWGGLAAVGAETENHSVGLTYLYTQTTEDTATLAIDTRGKEYYFPDYDPDDPSHPGNDPDNLDAAPYLRTETLEYSERTTSSLQLNGRHKLPLESLGSIGAFKFKRPELDWILADSSATLDQPDKRQFGALWKPESNDPGAPPFIPPFTTPETWFPYQPGANFTLGNLQRIFKKIEEDSTQYSLNLKLPFEQWSGDEGYVKLGLFDDQVDRSFDQDTYSNFDDFSSFLGGFDEPWSGVFPGEPHLITESLSDVDYKGEQEISATYGMIDLPLNDEFSIIGGARFESTKIGIVNDAEPEATWFPPGSIAPTALNPGDADVSFSQDDVLPSLGFEYQPVDDITMRTSWSQTVARQTFKELTPIAQQEYAGGPTFVGNPDLQMSGLTNWDFRIDWTPHESALLSGSWFYKDVDDPIEYVQALTPVLSFTTPVNYPEGRLSGLEFEARQDLGRFWDAAEGLSVGAAATFIDSKVTLPDDEAESFNLPAIDAPMNSRDMTNAPEHLYNLYFTYDFDEKTKAALFYTITGDTLVAGAGADETSGNFVPNVYAKEFGTLNLSLSRKLSEKTTLQFQAKNLTNPKIEEFYSSPYIGPDVTKTSYTTGREFSLGLTIRF
jgi:outer membrane receptor protein involved in Fe transport